MLSQGLSFIIFNASNQQEVQETISFYEAIGFHVVSDKTYKERTVWLRSESNTTIQLVLNSKAKKQAKPSTDSDWSLEEIALAFYTENLQVSPWLKFFIYASKPLSNCRKSNQSLLVLLYRIIVRMVM